MSGKTGTSVLCLWALVCATSVGALVSSADGAGIAKSMTLVAPSSLTATIRGMLMSGDLDVLLEWTDENALVSGFVVERYEGTDDYQPIASVGGDVRQYLDTTTVRGKRYMYRVRAYAGADTSEPSDSVSVFLPLPPIVVTEPEEGAVWYLGQEHRIRWSAPAITTVQIDYTVDEGDNWLPITMTGGVSQSSPYWGNYPWTPPRSIGPQPRVQIRVAQYQAIYMANYSGVFSLAEPGAVRGRIALSEDRPGLALVRESRGWTLHYRVPPEQRAVVALCDLGGRVVGQLTCERTSGAVNTNGIPMNTCIVARLLYGLRPAEAASALTAAVLGATQRP